ncbi:unnamed protein product [Echinostoma caproni]|uniref:Uncharacterized protein n=1 Tax=Echinostoma caproni TaxID=27848 RepID=A0A183ATN8_9TREM|nr:unnamed protein product [Echinostoma caproni]
MRLHTQEKPNNQRAVPVPETASVGVGPGVRNANHNVTLSEFSTFHITPLAAREGSVERDIRTNSRGSTSGPNTSCATIPSGANSNPLAPSEKNGQKSTGHHYPVAKGATRRGSKHKTMQNSIRPMEQSFSPPLRSNQATKTWHTSGRYNK